MKWSKIEKEYPRAFESYKEWLEDPVEIVSDVWLLYKNEENTLRIVNTRYLFDFFDDSEIYVCVWRAYAPDDTGWYSNMFEHWTGLHKKFDSRIKAETEAFTKAFAILEKQLSKE